jgi:hypothetical protein
VKLKETLKAGVMALALMVCGAQVGEVALVKGVFTMEHIRDGKVIYSESFPNLVATVGVNAMFDAALAGSAYTVTGPYMGLISSVGFSAVSNGDTMSSHAGWTEAGNANAPQYSGTRKTCAWSAASARSKALSAALSFAITTPGTLKGAFINFGSGATNVIDATTGTLFSAGLFTGGDRAVLASDTVNVSYSVSA